MTTRLEVKDELHRLTDAFQDQLMQADLMAVEHGRGSDQHQEARDQLDAMREDITRTYKRYLVLVVQERIEGEPLLGRTAR